MSCWVGVHVMLGGGLWQSCDAGWGSVTVHVMLGGVCDSHVMLGGGL